MAKKRTKRVMPQRNLSRRAAGPTLNRRPRLEAIAVTVATSPGDDPVRIAAATADRARLRGWRVEAVVASHGEFELVPPARRAITPGAAWDATYRLRDAPDVVHADPLFQYEVPEMQPPPRRARRAAREKDDGDPSTATDFEWSLEHANVIEAWALFGPREPGAGVVVGHPDTGYTPHPEMGDPKRILVSLGFDFDDDDSDPLDDLTDDLLDNPGHGTSTGSVIVSSRGASAGHTGREFVSGVAPFASLIPIRTTESVVLFSMRGLRQAIDHAVGKGAQVISISLGGPVPSPALRAAVRRAIDAGTIVLAAAGNQVRFVVFPAAFDEVIAVAASTIKDVPWEGSCRGDAVDITAPGASVWRAKTERAPDGGFMFSVERGDGTSYAVATTAGVAVLWVSFHGWTALERRYGAANIAGVFKLLMQQTCRTPRGWDTKNFGPGIVDAAALLSAPLPERVRARKLRDARRAAVATDTTSLETIVHLLPEAPRTGIERVLAETLHVSDRDLPHVLQDVGDELAFQLAMDPALRKELEQRARRPPGRRTARREAVTIGFDRRQVSTRLAARMAGKQPRRP